MSISILMYLCFKHLRYVTYMCSIWTGMVMRTFVQCVDRHSHEDRTLICVVCGQTWS